MAEKQKIINIAVIAHVDAGKSTLVDAFLKGIHRLVEGALVLGRGQGVVIGALVQIADVGP